MRGGAVAGSAGAGLLLAAVCLAVCRCRAQAGAEAGEPGGAVRPAVSGSGDSPARRTVAVAINQLEFIAEAGTSNPNSVLLTPAAPGAVEQPFILQAGVPYLQLVLRAAGPVARSGSLLGLVPANLTQDRAQAGECGTQLVLDAVGALTGNVKGVVSANGTTVVWDLGAGVKIGGQFRDSPSTSNRRRSAFNAAGYFKLCYTDSGSWASGATLVPSATTSIEVFGALPYTGLQFMFQKKHYCFAGAVPGTNCKVRLDGALGNLSGGADWTRTNRLTWANPGGPEDTCGSGDPIPVLGLGVATAPFVFGGQGGLVFDLGYTYKVEKRSFWLCYCPGFNANVADGSAACQNKADYRQQVGFLYIFIVSQTVATIVPVTTFSLQVTCGDVGGCPLDADNRIKILDPGDWQPTRNINNFPIWDPRSGCRTKLQSTHYVSPPNCVSATECSSAVNGGTKSDFKVFSRLKMDSQQESGLPKTRDFDVCFCAGGCLNDANWFKVGKFTVDKGWVASWITVSKDSTFKSLGVVNTPGVLRLGTRQKVNFTDGVNGTTNSLKGNPQLKLLADEGQQVTDAACAVSLPPPVFVNHGCTSPSWCFPYGWPNATSKTVTFNAKWFYGGLQAKAFAQDVLFQDTSLAVTVQRAGIFAVCYCEDGCDVDKSWGKITRLEIRGPNAGQKWVYQTLIPFNLVVKGCGLKPTNHIRILATNAQCTSATAENWASLSTRGTFPAYFNATLLTDSSSDWAFQGYPEANTIVDVRRYTAGSGSLLVFRYNAKGFGNLPIIKASDVLVISNTSVDTTMTFPYIYPATPQQQEIIEVPWGHVLTGFPPLDTSGQMFIISDALVNPDGTVPTWSPSMRASWKRTSEETYQALQTPDARRGLKVCWSDGGTDAGDFVVQAGTLDIEDAPLMVYSSANLVATKAGLVAPLVLAFKTSQAAAGRYRAATNSMMLRIVLENTHLTLRMADLAGTELRNDDSHNGLNREDQVVCSWLFRELWSSHPHGFPVPKGCFYVHSDSTYAIVFHPRNGMSSNTEYQIVLNVQTRLPPGDATQWSTNPVAQVFSMDDVILRAEYSIEVGNCYLRPDRILVSGAGDGDPQLASGGFRIWGTDRSPYVDLSATDPAGLLRFELRPADSSVPVRPGSHLRLFLVPLTAWNLDAACSASCLAVGTDPACGSVGVPACAGEALASHDGANRNIVHIQLQLDITTIAATRTANFSVNGLKLPTGGTFPTGIFVQMTDELDGAPDFKASSGKLLLVPPQLTFAGVVNTLAGDGNDRPFRGDRLNTLYVRIVFGASLRSQAADGLLSRSAAFTIQLPTDYTCAEMGSAPPDMTAFGSDVPTGNGRLPNSTSSALLGAWQLRSRECRFTLNPTGALYAGSSMFVGVVVNNPLYVLPMADPRNVWALTMESFGESNESQPVRTSSMLFRNSGGFFSNNVAVEGKLQASLAPTVYTAGARENYLLIFFQTEQQAGPRSQVRVLGPVDQPFDFGRKCEPSLLDQRYYVSVSPQPSTYPLPGMDLQVTCTGIQSATQPSQHYGAVIQLSGRLRGNRRYGFALRITNPEVFAASELTQWKVITYTLRREEIDETYVTVPPNPRQVELRSFGLYAYQPLQVDVLQSFVLALSTTLPTALTRIAATVAIGGIHFPSDTTCLFQVVAPGLYEWAYVTREFVYRPAEVMPLLPSQGILPDNSALVNEVLPTGTIPCPIVEPINQMRAAAPASFQAGRRYGLAAKVRVPSIPNTGSQNAFLVQCGPAGDTLATRPLAAVLEAPQVSAVVDASVGYWTNIAGRANRLRFHLQTTTAVRSGGALVIRGPPGFAGVPKCVPHSTLAGVDDELAAARLQLQTYELLLQDLAAKQAALGSTSAEFVALSAEAASQFEALKAGVASLWLQRRRGAALPVDVGCFYQPETTVQPFVQITFQVGLPNLDVDARLGLFARTYVQELFTQDQLAEASLPVGPYEFEIEFTNPSQVRSNREQAILTSAGAPNQAVAPTGCGYEQCWDLATYQAPYADRVPADAPAVTKGMAIVARMVDASLANLTTEQRHAVGADDRPHRSNQLVFTFVLNSTVDTPVPPNRSSSTVMQTLVIDAPQGYTFPNDCTVVTSLADVFGGVGLVPPDMVLANWSQDTGSITVCDGLGSVATIKINGAVGLLPGLRYAFRIDVQLNPVTTPWRNLWAIEFYGQQPTDSLGNAVGKAHAEASDPFPGVDLWTFASAQVVPRTTERSSGVATDVRGGVTLGSITVLFTVHSAVPASAGALRLSAPRQFDFIPSSSASAVNASNGGAACSAKLLEQPDRLPPEADTVVAAGSLGISFWTPLQASCAIHPVFQYVLHVRPVGSRGLQAGRRYALVAQAANPDAELPAGTFELSSWGPAFSTGLGSTEPGLEGLELLDIADITGFPVTKGLHLLAVVPGGGATAARGGQVGAIRGTAAFVEPVFPGDILRFTLPPFYMLRASQTDATSLLTRKQCLRMVNFAKPGVLPDQTVRCFSGLPCRVRLSGVGLADSSAVQLNAPDHPCGDLPGLWVDTRRTTATGSASAVSKDFPLGFNLTLGTFRICYCHGDGPCALHRDFCQDAGNLSVVDLCAGASCPPSNSSCATRCDPRTGRCVDTSLPALQRPDGYPCTSGGGGRGNCSQGTCVLGPAMDVSSIPVAIVSTALPVSCAFDTFECTDRVLTWTVGHAGYARQTAIQFELLALHPMREPPEDNVFAMAHVRSSEVRGSRVVDAYGIQTTFASIRVALTGALRAGGALSEITLSLVPIQNAASIWLRGKEPIGFDFSLATVAAPAAILSAKGDSIEVRAALHSAQLLTLKIGSVHLPPAGGWGAFDVVTYNGTTAMDSVYNLRVFRTPVHVEVSEPQLLNQYKRDTTGQFSVEASFGNRLGEWVQLRMRLSFSAPLQGPLTLRVAAPSWRVSPVSATFREQFVGEPAVPMNFSRAGVISEDGSADELLLRFTGQLRPHPHYSYLLAMDVFAPSASACDCWKKSTCMLCVNSWAVEALDGGDLPLATNDALLQGFPLVSQLRFSVFANRAPPSALLDLTLRLIEVGAIPSTTLLVTAPEGYEFPYSCLTPTNVTVNVSELPSFTGCVGRLNGAVLQLYRSGLFRTTTVALQVRTPPTTPADNRWYVEGRLVNSNIQVGWGVATGLVNEVLRQVSVDYGAFQTLSTFFLVQFASGVDVEEAGSIEVWPPPGYLLSCDGFRPYVMPSSPQHAVKLQCAQLRQGIQLSFLHATLQTSQEYSFIVRGGTAAASATIVEDDTFAVQLLDQTGRVVESNSEIPAAHLVSFGGVQQPTLLWYDDPQPGATIWATIGLQVPQNVVPGTQAMRITMPEGFKHAVTTSDRLNKANGVTVAWRPVDLPATVPGIFSDYLRWVQLSQAAGTLASSISAGAATGNGSAAGNASGGGAAGGLAPPLVQDDRRWLDLGQSNAVGVNFDTKLTFPACDLYIRFPVVLPVVLPSINVWRVSVSFASAARNATASAPASFVVPGFAFGDASRQDLVRRALYVFQYAGLKYYAFSQKYSGMAAGIGGAHPLVGALAVSLAIWPSAKR